MFTNDPEAALPVWEAEGRQSRQSELVCRPRQVRSALFSRHGTGKGTFFVAEQLTFDQRSRHCGTTDFDEWAGAGAP